MLKDGRRDHEGDKSPTFSQITGARSHCEVLPSTLRLKKRPNFDLL